MIRLFFGLLILAVHLNSVSAHAQADGSRPDAIADMLEPCRTSDYYKANKALCDAKTKQDKMKQQQDETRRQAQEKANQEDLAKNGVAAKDICKKDGGSRFSRAALANPLGGSKDSAKDAEGLPVLVASLRRSEMKAIYSEVIDAYYPYELALGGTTLENIACEKRAHVIGCDLKNKCGIVTGKVFVESQSGEFPVDLGSGGRTSWKAHVANVLYEEDENGNPQLVVIDPLLNRALKRKGPIPYKEWFDVVSAKGQNKLKTTFSYPGQMRPESRYAGDNRADANCISPKNMIDIHNQGRKVDAPPAGATR